MSDIPRCSQEQLEKIERAKKAFQIMGSMPSSDREALIDGLRS